MAATTTGTNWRHLTAAHPEIEKVSSLLVDGATVLAGTWRRAYKSYDGGASWRGVFSGMLLDSEVFSLQPGTGGRRGLGVDLRLGLSQHQRRRELAPLSKRHG